MPKGSSLNSFTNVSGSRLTLTDYNTFESDDPFYGTMFDSGLDKIDAKRIAEVARLIAGAALRMSMKDKEQFTLKTDVLNKLVDSDFVQHTIATAAELAECFVDPKVGLRKCSFSQKYDVFGSDGLSEEDEINETNNIGSPYVAASLNTSQKTSKPPKRNRRFRDLSTNTSHAWLTVRQPRPIASLYLRNLSLIAMRLRGKFETETLTGTKSGPNRIGRQNLVLHSRVIKGGISSQLQRRVPW